MGSIDEDLILIEHFLYRPHEDLHGIHEAARLIGHHVHLPYPTAVLKVLLEAGDYGVHRSQLVADGEEEGGELSTIHTLHHPQQLLYPPLQTVIYSLLIDLQKCQCCEVAHRDCLLQVDLPS